MLEHIVSEMNRRGYPGMSRGEPNTLLNVGNYRGVVWKVCIISGSLDVVEN